MYKKLIVLILTLGLFGCSASSPLEVVRGLLGYIPPPEETTVSEELKLEFERCQKIGVEKYCAQAAYDVVRRVKGLEPRTVPKGVVIILEGDGGYGDRDEKEKSNPDESQ